MVGLSQIDHQMILLLLIRSHYSPLQTQMTAKIAKSKLISKEIKVTQEGIRTLPSIKSLRVFSIGDSENKHRICARSKVFCGLIYDRYYFHLECPISETKGRGAGEGGKNIQFLKVFFKTY